MSTVEIARSRPFQREIPSAASGRVSPAGPILLVCLLALALYAAFDHGAGGVSAAARLQTAVCLLAAAATAAWLWTGGIRLAAPRLAATGIALLLAFAVWNGITLAWSVAPDQTWLELNRALLYVLVLGLAVAIGSSFARSLDLLARGLVVVVLAVGIYALAYKLFPGLPGLGQAQFVPRLQEPFGYWNALGLFLVFGVPPSLALASDPSRGQRERLAALLSAEWMLLAISLTYSRGAVVALAAAVVMWVRLGGAGLRSLLWFAVACLATVPPLVFGLTFHDLTTVSASLSSRELAGLALAALEAVSLAVLWVAGRRLIDLEQRVRIDPERAHRIRRTLAGAAAVVLACALIAVALSSRGLPGTVSHAWNTFTTTRTTSNYDPGRLLSADSENRWVWWKEAAGAFSDRPLTGWGAGSFGVVHLLYRRDLTSVAQPHSVPLQFLAELGIVGALLGIVGYVLLVAAGVCTVRRCVGTRERAVAAALVATVIAYGVHALYDWDWDIPGITIPALVVAGVLAGRGGRDRATPRTWGAATRLLGLASVCALLAAVALSGVIPSVAAGEASAALVDASGSSPGGLPDAQASALAASRLDPLSDAGLLAAATIGLHRGQLEQPQRYLFEAITRDPEDVQAWTDLASLEFSVGDYASGLSAAERAVQLDPRATSSRRLLREVELFATPPGDSATSRASPPG